MVSVADAHGAEVALVAVVAEAVPDIEGEGDVSGIEVGVFELRGKEMAGEGLAEPVAPRGFDGEVLEFLVFRVGEGVITQLEREGMRITVMNERITAVSSTLIRKDVNSAKALLPEYIYDYIKAGGIYGV